MVQAKSRPPRGPESWRSGLFTVRATREPLKEESMETMTATRDGLNLSDLVRDDRVHRTVYTDPKLFDFEMERIFERILGLCRS